MAEVHIVKTNGNLEESLNLLLENLKGLKNFIKKNDNVVLKPNFVAPFSHATTDINLIILLVKKINELEAHPIVAESSGYEFDTKSTFDLLNLPTLAKEYHFELINLDERKYSTIKTDNSHIRYLNVSEVFLRADVIINLPRMKGHSITNVSLAMKNLYGCIDRATRSRGHAYGLHECIYQVNKIIKPTLVIMDGLTEMERAVYAKPKPRGLLLASTDNISTDKVACDIMGVKWSDIKHIKKELAAYNNPITSNYIGQQVDLPVQTNKVLTRSLVRKLAYKIIYNLECLLGKMHIQYPLISNFHWYFGIRPHLNKKYFNEDCRICVEICPVNAIDFDKKKIIKEKCMHVRCLKCVEVCPNKAITVKGFGKNV